MAKVMKDWHDEVPEEKAQLPLKKKNRLFRKWIFKNKQKIRNNSCLSKR